MDDYCNVEHKNCCTCVAEVLEENDRLFKEEQQAYENEMETLLWEEEFNR